MQRQNDPWLLTMQITLPLLVLMALNPLPQARFTTPDQAVRQMLLLEPWHAASWDNLLAEDAHQANWTQLISDAGISSGMGLLSDQGKMLWGDAYEQVGQKSLAVKTWQSAATVTSSARFEKMLRVQRELNDLDGALATLKQWTILEPQNGQLYYQAGLLQSVLSPREAPAALERALFLDAGYKKQVQILKQALDLDVQGQGDAYRQVVVGRALANLNEWVLAHEDFRRAAAEKPDYAEAWAFLGESERQLGQDDFPSLSKALALDPHSTAAQSLTARYWIRAGQPDKALAIFQGLVKQEPKQAVWEIESGDALARMGQPPLAMVHYQNAINLEPDNPQNWAQLVQFCLKNDIEVRRIGLPAARRLVMLSPDGADAYDLHGQVLMALGDRDNALQAFFRGLKMNPVSAQLLLDVGILEISRQEINDASYYLSRAVEAGRQQKDPVIVQKAQALIDQLQ